MRAIIGVNDFSDAEIDWVVGRAHELASGARISPDSSRPLLGLMFLESSLRTRVGFASAAHRLGWSSIDVAEVRPTGPLHAESIQDTLRVLSGYTDVIAVRPGCSLRDRCLVEHLKASLINCGDVGSDAQHPTQALIDLFAIERLRGPIEEQVIAIVGDLRMRSARSLLAVLARRRPRDVIAITHPALLDVNTASCAHRISHSLSSAASADVVYVVGMPDGSLPETERLDFAVDQNLLSLLREDAAVLSPMPVLDEISQHARPDPRVRIHEQSDLGLFVRMAVLEFLKGLK